MKNDVKSKWDDIITLLKNNYNVADVSFRTWLKPLKIYSQKNRTLTIVVDVDKQGHSSELIQSKYMLPLKVTIEEVTGQEFELEFVDSTDLDKDSSSHLSASLTNKYPFLNSGHSFDNFVVSGSNSMAHSAALAVAESPTAQVYNPLYIYGGSGLGKTHLMHSIARYIIEHNSNLNVTYVTSEAFTNEVIAAIRTNTTKHDPTAMTNLKKKYRNVDVLLIDDIQFIIGKESTQEEFFHTFNALQESGKQIIISSDKPPRDIELLEERMRSRFMSGLQVDIQPPDYETSMAILIKLQEQEPFKFDNSILSFIASNINSNVRELEGAFNKIIVFKKLNKNKEVTMEVVEDALRDIISPNSKQVITADFITNVVAEHLHIDKEMLLSQKRTKDIAEARQICMYLCSEYTNLSQIEIAKALNKSNHSTVIHAVDKIKNLITGDNVDNSLKTTIDILVNKLNVQ